MNTEQFPLYLSFIDVCKTKVIHADTYTEKHHIIPRSMGGTHAAENLITLSFHDHVYAHYLLAIEAIGQFRHKALTAFNCMINVKRGAPPIWDEEAIKAIVLLREEFHIQWLKDMSEYWESPGAREAVSVRMVERCSSTEERKLMSERRKRYLINNPETGKEHSKKLKAYYETTPGAREASGERTKKVFEKPGYREAHSQRTKAFIINNPEVFAEQAEARRLAIRTPEARARISKSQKERFKNPEELIKNGERSKHYWSNPEARKRQSERRKAHFAVNPEARKENGERIKAHYANNPDARKSQSERLKAYYENNPEARLAVSKRAKAYYANNPGARDANGEIKKAYFSKPENRIKCSEATKQFIKNNPEKWSKQMTIMELARGTPEAKEKHKISQNKRWANNHEAKRACSKDTKTNPNQATARAIRWNKPFSWLPAYAPEGALNVKKVA